MFIAALFVTVKTEKKKKKPNVYQQVSKQNVVYPYSSLIKGNATTQISKQLSERRPTQMNTYKSL